MGLHVDNRPISYAQLWSFSAVIASQIFVAGGLYWSFVDLKANAATKSDLAAVVQRLDAQDKARIARTANTDQKFDKLAEVTQPLGTLQFQMGKNDAKDAAQDDRIDRVVDSFNAKVDKIIDAVNELKVEVKAAGKEGRLFTTPEELAPTTALR